MHPRNSVTDLQQHVTSVTARYLRLTAGALGASASVLEATAALLDDQHPQPAAGWQQYLTTDQHPRHTTPQTPVPHRDPAAPTLGRR